MNDHLKAVVTPEFLLCVCGHTDKPTEVCCFKNQNANVLNQKACYFIINTILQQTEDETSVSFLLKPETLSI